MAFYWLNTGNMIEWDGPFESVEVTKEHCRKAYVSIGDIPSFIVVVCVVEKMSVTEFKQSELEAQAVAT